ncbi:hypothetical protein PFISCL1PPCAC_23931, partial [Pristionchus fissidentatus]
SHHEFNFVMLSRRMLQIPQIVYSQSVCLQFIEKCGETVIDVERYLVLHRTRAFSQCVTSPICAEERKVFDQCFTESFRAKSSSDGSNQFLQTFLDYRQGLMNCLDTASTNVSFLTCKINSPLSELASMARILYESDMGDQLWSLNDGEDLRSIEVTSVCKKSLFGRLFGAGINRLLRTSEPTINNLTSSCFLEDSAISCYHSLLRYNKQYVQLLSRRDSMLTQCLDSIPISCISSQSSQCLCAARLSFEVRYS